MLAQALGDTRRPELHLEVSNLLKDQRLFSQSARHRALAKRPEEALELLIQVLLLWPFSHRLLMQLR